ncbi:MAG: hypothetical protein O4861_14300 [Trichodesmium sp. St16_bin4-tuft]|nr:hypothetical protein [Trichodesmium sp. MAG_R01]MDE5068433.1 hypothetical protein [Trichodesmium sp. St4_bin8_1]MDE5073474.1 hypothetical protein [Trichodesmium sp. St5_bin8]MDE5078503.1 hypothetical protein [Trichodesmium sp. St2_bin6]MDE5099433.1 hypothetical protein [Trichodesmium sp. St16_bin4-tuft]MDE5104932.1 hypothetical protein [Trichodesmium sp. St19_bin2]
MFSQKEAENLAIDFLINDWEIPQTEKDWFTIRYAKQESSWYIVEVGIKGCPDYWILQVYDTGECDPCYTFVSPLSSSEDTDDLQELPESITNMISLERSSQEMAFPAKIGTILKL